MFAGNSSAAVVYICSCDVHTREVVRLVSSGLASPRLSWSRKEESSSTVDVIGQRVPRDWSMPPRSTKWSSHTPAPPSTAVAERAESVLALFSRSLYPAEPMGTDWWNPAWLCWRGQMPSYCGFRYVYLMIRHATGTTRPKSRQPSVWSTSGWRRRCSLLVTASTSSSSSGGGNGGGGGGRGRAPKVSTFQALPSAQELAAADQNRWRWEGDRSLLV